MPLVADRRWARGIGAVPLNRTGGEEMEIKRRLAEFESLTPAEEKLRDEIGEGEIVIIGDGKRPAADAGEERRVSAAFLRYLILGGCDALPKPVSENGIGIRGVRITGVLDLDGCAIPRNIFLVNCLIEATPSLRSARIETLNLNRSVLPGLNGDGLAARGAVLLRSAESTGEVRLIGGRLGSDLDCAGALLLASENGKALTADRLEVSGSMRLARLFAEGEVRLPGTTIGSDLDCQEACVSATETCSALSAHGLQAAGTVFLSGLAAHGEVRLHGSTVGGDLGCKDARFTAKEPRPALSADGITVAGSVFLENLTARGEVRLVGSKLGGDLACQEARVTARSSGRALLADHMKAAGSVFLERLIVWGEFRLAGAKLGGNLDCYSARLRQKQGEFTLLLQGAEIGGGFVLLGDCRIDGLLDLTAAQLGTIVDEKASWPARGNLFLDRCRYGAFVGSAPVTPEDRIAWLSLQDPARFDAEFRPQPWEQCAEVLRQMGHGEAARKVLIEKEKRQRRGRRARLGRVMRAAVWAGDMALGLTTRYGRRPLVAVPWLAVLWLLGAGWFYGADQYAALKPNDSIVLRSPEWAACAENGARRGNGDYASQLACFEDQPEAAGHPAFQPAVYSADTLLPFVDLEMQSFWIPDGAADWRFAAATRWYLWVHIALGWALSLLAVAGFSGLIKTDSQ